MSATTLASLPDSGGVFSANNLAAVNTALTAQNANNAVYDAAIAALSIGTAFTGADGLTAHSGGGQGSALLLAATVNRVATVAAIADSVKLPVSAAGAVCVVVNDAALSLQAFGSGTDTLDDVATATGVGVPGKSTAVFWCPVAGKWYQTNRSFLGLQVLSADGAVLPRVAATYLVTKAGVALLTLAAPTATVDDGKVITISSNTTNAHTLTATGLLGTGSASVNVATFAAFLGAGLTLMAYQAKWLVISSVGITFS